jgi:hypothetical protein
MRKRGPRYTLATETSRGHAFKRLGQDASISGNGLNPSLGVASTETVNLGDLAMKEVQSTSQVIIPSELSEWHRVMLVLHRRGVQPALFGTMLHDSATRVRT